MAVEYKGLDETLRLLKDTEPEIYKQLIQDIRQAVEPGAKRIEERTPKVSPFAGRRKDGMTHGGRTGWSPVVALVQVTPFGYKGSGGSRRVVSILATGSQGVGFDIVDMAGKKGGKTPSGRAMIRNLPGKPSRYAYPAVEAEMPQITENITNIIDVAAQKINRKLDRI